MVTQHRTLTPPDSPGNVAQLFPSTCIDHALPDYERLNKLRRLAHAAMRDRFAQRPYNDLCERQLGGSTSIECRNCREIFADELGGAQHAQSTGHIVTVELRLTRAWFSIDRFDEAQRYAAGGAS